MYDDKKKVFPTLDGDTTSPASAIHTASSISQIGVRERFQGGTFVASPKLRSLTHGAREFIAIGESYGTPIVVACDDFSVWILYSGGNALLVNSHYSLFDKTMDSIDALNLDKADGSDLDALEEMAESVRVSIFSIDPRLAQCDNFWSEFAWDVQSGNYAGDPDE